MRYFGLVAAILVVIGALGFGGWKYARNEGLIAGSPYSPRPENFKRVLDQYLPNTIDPQARLCASIGYGVQHLRSIGFPDTRLHYSPPTFLARPGPDSPSQMRGRLDHFAKHGLLKSAQGDGGTEYTMTWKGFAASNGAGCVYLAGIERNATVLAHKRVRVERGGEEVYQVVIKALPLTIEPWAADPDFAAVFEKDGIKYRTEIDPAPVAYEMGRFKDGIRVLGEQAVVGQRVTSRAASDARPVLGVEPGRLLGLVDAYVAKGQGTRNYACLDIVAGGADEVAHEALSVTGASRPPKAVTYYNFPDRTGEQLHKVLLSYETMRRLESLGLATSELLAVGEFGRRAAAGGTRFELSQGLRDQLEPGRNCVRVGTLHAEEILVADKFSSVVQHPRFWVRMRMKVIEGREAIAAKFGHFARMQDPGFQVQGKMVLSGNDLQVESLSYYFPEFTFDPAQVRLPAVEPAVRGAPVPAQRLREERKEKSVPRTFARPLRPDERMIRCGGDTIICDSKDTVVCGGRAVPCR